MNTFPLGRWTANPFPPASVAPVPVVLPGERKDCAPADVRGIAFPCVRHFWNNKTKRCIFCGATMT